MSTWAPLPETRCGHTPKEPVVTFSRATHGFPRVYFNKLAIELLGLKAGERVAFLAPPATQKGRVTLGLMLVERDGVVVKPSHASASFHVTTAALEHLRQVYRKITFRPRAGGKDEPAFVLEALTSEKDPLPGKTS